jgi:hypothetical protein
MSAWDQKAMTKPAAHLTTPRRLLTLEDVLAIVPVSRATLFRMQSNASRRAASSARTGASGAKMRLPSGRNGNQSEHCLLP